MKFLIGIGSYIKTHILIVSIVSTVVVGGLIATPIITHNLNSNSKYNNEDFNNKNESTSPIKEEDSKDIVIKLNVSGECPTTKKNSFSSGSCKVDSYEIKNDENGIFKEIDFNGLEYCDVYGSMCVRNEENIAEKSVLNKIYEISIQYNLNLIPDYRYMKYEEYNNVREIILKPLEDLKWEGIFNLNDNIAVSISTRYYGEWSNQCMGDAYDGTRVYDLQKCQMDYSFANKTLSSGIDVKLKNQPYYKIGDIINYKQVDGTDVQEILVQQLSVYGNPKFYKESSYNLLGTYKNGYRDLYSNKFYHDKENNVLNLGDLNLSSFEFNQPTIENSYIYTILDESLCEEYHLKCDRW